ncbi:hypothetical protein GCM10023168_30010 [Fodinibacter luteus]|uniref:Uncharacterized protein n=1 Tax=Fodinibacter luteus TaxID=552064 RepID=A0ABP8KNB2_9MICO
MVVPSRRRGPGARSGAESLDGTDASPASHSVPHPEWAKLRSEVAPVTAELARQRVAAGGGEWRWRDPDQLTGSGASPPAG